jgi:signal transduction histidine kinase
VTIFDGLSGRWRQARSLIGLGLLTWGMIQTSPHPALYGRGLAVLVGMVLAGAGWITMALRLGGTRVQVAAILVCGGAGVALMSLDQPGLPLVYVAAACLSAGMTLPVGLATALWSALLTGYAVTQIFWLAGPVWMLGTPATTLVALLSGVIRRQREERLEQSQLLLAETQLAREEQARAAALAERGRIAREIHDVLSHALAALSVQLETTDALLEGGRSDQARATLDRARQLTREGLSETRRAIGALRGDVLPLPDLVRALVDGYAEDTGATATSTVDGDPRDLPPDAALALYRTAQEALTNVRKHAPGADVRLRLCYEPEQVRIEVDNCARTDPSLRPPASPIPGGYGLAGLRERAELVGGQFTAGPPPDSPDGQAWRVSVRIPG